MTKSYKNDFQSFSKKLVMIQNNENFQYEVNLIKMKIF